MVSVNYRVLSLVFALLIVIAIISSCGKNETIAKDQEIREPVELSDEQSAQSEKSKEAVGEMLTNTNPENAPVVNGISE